MRNFKPRYRIKSTIYGEIIERTAHPTKTQQPTTHSMSTSLSNPCATTLIPSSKLTSASSMFTQSTVFPLPTLCPRPSRLLLINLTLVLRHVLLQMLDLVLQPPNLLLHLCLETVRGAFAGGDSLLVDDEETAVWGWGAVSVAFTVGCSAPGTGGSAGGEEGGGLGFAAAFVGKDVVVAHC